MPRAKTETNGTNGTKTGSTKEPGKINLSDLAVEGREFELEGKTYKTKSPIMLELPEIARIDKMGKQLNVWLPAFGEGNYDDIDMDKFQSLLIEMVVDISNVPKEVAEKTKWWQQILIIGLFQTTSGMDFLEKQLPQLKTIPEEERMKIQTALRESVKVPESSTQTSTSPTP